MSDTSFFLVPSITSSSRSRSSMRRESLFLFLSIKLCFSIREISQNENDSEFACAETAHDAESHGEFGCVFAHVEDDNWRVLDDLYIQTDWVKRIDGEDG